MKLAEVAIVLALFLLSGGALALALLLTRRVRLARERRIMLVAIAAARPVDVMGAWLTAHSKRLDVRAQRIFAAGAHAIWGMKTGALMLTAVAAAGAAAGWTVANIVLGLPGWLAAPAAFALGFYFPRWLLLRQQTKADREFTDLFPDAIDAMTRMLRAGLPITTAVRSVSLEAPAPVNSVFAMVADQMSIGAPIEEALDTSSRHIGLPDFRFFTVAVVLQHLTGGNLAQTLEVLSEIVRKRRAVRLKARATTAEIRVSAYVLGGLPIFIVLVLALVQPGYLAPLFIDPRGHVLLAIAAGLLLAAFVTMRQMMRSVTTI